MTTIQIHDAGGACVAWEVIVEWAERNHVWNPYRRVARRELNERMAGTGQGISSSDINHTTVQSIVQDFGVLIAHQYDLLDEVQFVDEGDPENPVIRGGYVCNQSNAVRGYIAVNITTDKGYNAIMAVHPGNIIERGKK